MVLIRRLVSIALLFALSVSLWRDREYVTTETLLIGAVGALVALVGIFAPTRTRPLPRYPRKVRLVFDSERTIRFPGRWRSHQR